MSSLEFYFKKTMCGMVLMKKHQYRSARTMDIIEKYDKATEEESQELLTLYTLLKHNNELIDDIKKTHPELLI